MCCHWSPDIQRGYLQYKHRLGNGGKLKWWGVGGGGGGEKGREKSTDVTKKFIQWYLW